MAAKSRRKLKCERKATSELRNIVASRQVFQIKLPLKGKVKLFLKACIALPQSSAGEFSKTNTTEKICILKIMIFFICLFEIICHSCLHILCVVETQNDDIFLWTCFVILIQVRTFSFESHKLTFRELEMSQSQHCNIIFTY